MKKIIFIVLFFILVVFHLSSQRRSAITVNYLYLNQAGNQGVGIGYKIQVWNKLMFLADADYFIRNYYGQISESYKTEYYTSYSALNLNLGYHIDFLENIHIIPYAGFGFFVGYKNGYMYSAGGNSSWNGSGSWPPYNVEIKETTPTITANIGVSVEYSFSDHFFATGGIKYMLDLYDGRYNQFPSLNLGIGYQF